MTGGILHRLALSVLLLGMASPAATQDLRVADRAFGFLNRVAVHSALLTLRTRVDLTYDSVGIAPGSGDLTINGLRLYPVLGWDPEGACEVSVGRLTVAELASFETVEALVEAADIELPLACLAPAQRDVVTGLGYGGGIWAERMSLDLSYDVPSAAARIGVELAFAEAAELGIEAAFDYLWVRLPARPGEQAEPVALLGALEMTLTNRGLWERVEPVLAAQTGDIRAVPDAARNILPQVLGDSPAVRAFAEELAAGLARFVEARDRIVLTARPEQGLFLSPGLFADAAGAIAALNPRVSHVPEAARRLIAPALLTRALAGGEGLDEPDRLAAGRALLTGIGAPRAPARGQILLAPLAASWHPEAAGLIAAALADTGASAEAYRHALIALAGGDRGAAGLADRLETRLPLDTLLRLQDETARDWPGAAALVTTSEAAIAAGDLATLRKLAFRAASGRGMPRNAPAAYYWATLAAAGGAQSAAALRDRLDRQFTARNRTLWRARADKAAAEALETWTEGGLGARLGAP